MHSDGKGYATEAVGPLVDEAFRNHGAERIFGNVFVGHDPSRRVMEKLGFVYEGTLPRVVCKRGVWLDSRCSLSPAPTGSSDSESSCPGGTPGRRPPVG